MNTYHLTTIKVAALGAAATVLINAAIFGALAALFFSA